MNIQIVKKNLGVENEYSIVKKKSISTAAVYLTPSHTANCIFMHLYTVINLLPLKHLNELVEHEYNFSLYHLKYFKIL